MPVVKKSAVLTIVVAMLLSTAVHAEKVLTKTPRPINCGQLIEQSPNALPASHFWWLMGSLRARAIVTEPDTDRVFRSALRIEIASDIEKAVLSYCRRYPLKDLGDAELDIYIQLGGKVWIP